MHTDIDHMKTSKTKSVSSRRCFVSLLLVLVASAPLAAGTDPAATPSSPSMPELFDGVLRRHVTDGHVNYPGIAGDPRYTAYLQYLQQIDAETLPTRADKLAFWINAYNALAIKGILDGYSPYTFFGKVRFFYRNEYAVGGKQISLYDLEHKVLIPLNEPRIHFAIVCASKSCPKLRAEAYTAERLEQQLEEDARQFINDPQRNRFDREQKTAQLSKIFDWFETDFKTHSGSVQRYLARYVADANVAKALAADAYEIDYLRYDWNLNGTPIDATK